jgi:serine/threonine-protein kinase
VWVTRQGVEQTITPTSRPYLNPRLSPDGQRIVVEISGGDLWVQDLARQTLTRLTTGPTVAHTFAVWSPDGTRVVFRTLTGIRWVDPASAGESHQVPSTTVNDLPTSMSRDGRTLIFIRQSPGGDLYSMPLDAGSSPTVLVKTPAYDGGGQLSPDERWLAYVSGESGEFQVYLRPFPGPDRKVPVSVEGGTHPKWAPSGRELFYRTGNKMMVVDVSDGANPSISPPRVLFEQRYAFGSAQTIGNYDVSRDGQRFLMVRDDSAAGRVNVVLNWAEELKRLAPVESH